MASTKAMSASDYVRRKWSEKNRVGDDAASAVGFDDAEMAVGSRLGASFDEHSGCRSVVLFGRGQGHPRRIEIAGRFFPGSTRGKWSVGATVGVVGRSERHDSVRVAVGRALVRSRSTSAPSVSILQARSKADWTGNASNIRSQHARWKCRDQCAGGGGGGGGGGGQGVCSQQSSRSREQIESERQVRRTAERRSRSD